jgi:hypothetical protein
MPGPNIRTSVWLLFLFCCAIVGCRHHSNEAASNPDSLIVCPGASEVRFAPFKGTQQVSYRFRWSILPILFFLVSPRT